jgi:hypothetical protein
VLDEHWEVLLPHTRNVNATRWQCASAAIANNLAYLKDTFGLHVPHPFEKGWKGDGTLPGIIDALGARPISGPCDKAGLIRCRTSKKGGFIDALYGYLREYAGQSSVALRHVGLDHLEYPTQCKSVPSGGPVSVREDPRVTFDWVCDRIENGDGVLLSTFTYEAVDMDGHFWPGENLVQKSAHMVRVYGCGETAGQRFFRVLDDGQQDTMLGEPATCTAREGLRWSHWWFPDNTYDLKLWVNGNELRKVEFAMAIEAL